MRKYYFDHLKEIYNKNCLEDLKQLKGIDIIEEYRKYIEWYVNQDEYFPDKFKKITIEEIKDSIKDIDNTQNFEYGNKN